MEKLDLLFYSVEAVAARWKLPVGHVWQFAAKGELELLIWHNGYCVRNEPYPVWDPATPGPKPELINQWVSLAQDDVLQFAVPPYVDQIDIFRVKVDDDDMYPIDDEVLSGALLCTGYICVKRDTVVVATEEIARMEDKYPELRGEVAGQAGKNKTNELHPAEKKSLLKMVYAMAIDGYGYDPEAKKSPVPGEIVRAVELADMSIEADTVRKYLKEGKVLEKDIV